MSFGISDLLFGGKADPFFGPTGLFSNPTGAWDNFKNGRTNDVNQQIAEENLEYQRERNEIEDARYEDETAYNREFAENERDYQRALQQQIFEREDTSIERQANQLSKVGINPLSQNMNGLGSGQALGSVAEPSTSSRGGSPLHNDFQMQDVGLLGAIQPLMSLFQGASDMYTGTLQRDGLREQNDYQRLLNQEKDIENRFKEIRLQKELDNLTADTESKQANTKTTNELREYEVKDKKATAERNERENIFQEKYGVSDLTDKKVRLVTDLEKLSTQDRTLEPPIKTVSELYTKPLNNAYKTVSKALSNSIGKGAKAIYGTFSRLAEKSKKRSEESKTYYYDKNGKRRRMYNTYFDDRL